MGFHKLSEILEDQHWQELENDIYWQFKHITGHQSILRKNDRNYKGCNNNVTVEWGDRSIRHEPLNILVMMSQKIVQNSGRNMSYWMNLNGNSFTILPNQKETSMHDKHCKIEILS